MRRFALPLLFSFGLLLAAGNVWFTAVRSTIPRSLDERIAGMRRTHEHAKGVDDVCILQFERGGWIQVDPHVYDHVRIGDTLQKNAWAHHLEHGGRELRLDWSRDFRRMAWLMPATLLVLGALSLAAWRESRTPVE
jgi:hypothetical protein